MSAIRVLVGVLGMDQHEVGAVAIAKTLRDEGMEVIYTGCFNTPETIVRTAIEEDADVIGIPSCHPAPTTTPSINKLTLRAIHNPSPACV